MAAKNILVIGGSGFLGAGLCLALAREGHFITNYSRGILPEHFGDGAEAENICTSRHSILDGDALRQAISKADIVYHYAAVSTVKSAAQDAVACFQTNVVGTGNLAKALREAGGKVEKLILASSISVYGEGAYFCCECGPVRPPLREAEKRCENFEPVCPNCGKDLSTELISEEAERNGSSVYARSKITQEDILTELARETQIPVAFLRYATVYGPRQSETSPYRGFFNQLANGEKIVLTEDGRQTRDFLFVDDALKVNLQLLKQAWSGNLVLNVGSCAPMPLIRFGEKMRQEFLMHADCAGSSISTNHEILAGDVRHCNIDCSRLRAVHALDKITSLEDGIKVTVKAFLDSKIIAQAGRI